MSPSTLMQSTVRYNLILIQDVTEDYQSLNEKYDEENMERKVLDFCKEPTITTLKLGYKGFGQLA